MPFSLQASLASIGYGCTVVYRALVRSLPIVTSLIGLCGMVVLFLCGCGAVEANCSGGEMHD